MAPRPRSPGPSSSTTLSMEEGVVLCSSDDDQQQSSPHFTEETHTDEEFHAMWLVIEKSHRERGLVAPSLPHPYIKQEL